jgi:uncharacterized protein YbaR (Trm112 family)
MKSNLIQKLCCPFDKKELELQVFVKDLDDHIIEGLFTCTNCKRYYPIVYGVPIMSPDEYRQKELEVSVLKRWENKLDFSHVEEFKLLGTNKD